MRRLFALLFALVLLLSPTLSLEAAPQPSQADGVSSLVLKLLAWDKSQTPPDPANPGVELAPPDDDTQTTSTTPDSEAELYPEMDPDG